MNDEQYLQHCLALLSDFAKTMITRTGHLPEDDSLRGLAEAFGALADSGADLYPEGANLITRLFTTYPDFAPTFPGNYCGFLVEIACITCPMTKSNSISSWRKNA